MDKLLLAGVGGFMGSVARYWLSGVAQRLANGRFPAGTLAVNVIGCFAIGALAYMFEDRQLLSPNARVFLIVGILGGFTTFSAFGNETFELLRDGNFPLVFWNISSNVVLGLLAVWGGRVCVKALGV